MNIFLRQNLALIRKNLLIICVRRPISTFIRAIAFPLLVVLLLAYSKNFLSAPQQWGISSPHVIVSFEESLSSTRDRSILGFVDNGMKGGEVSDVIDALSKTARGAGKTVKLFENSLDLGNACRSDLKGKFPCYGGVVFLSSPKQGSTYSSPGCWNYTLRSDATFDAGFTDVTNHKNGPETRLLPLQRAIDSEIIARTPNATKLPDKVQDVMFTQYGGASLQAQTSSNYLALCLYVFAPVFAFAMAGITYHMTAFVAAERELGMSPLIDTMLPGSSASRARLVRQISTYVSFACLYLPSWLAVGIVVSVVVFPKTSSHGVPVAYHILSGLGFCSFTLFGASFFKKAQLSGSLMLILVIVFAILPVVLMDQTKAMVGVFSLLFPTANYSYYITGMAKREMDATKDEKTRQIESLGYDAQPWCLSFGVLWALLALQTVIYPVLAFYVEKLLFSTESAGRTVAPSGNPSEPTVVLSGFCKTYKPGLFGSLFKRSKDTHAVKEMNLIAFPGQILCLLGPNGSGKSTTLNCISGQHKVTSGKVAINSSGGLGYAPQANVIWPELTVAEHVRIFSDLKCLSAVNEEVTTSLVRSCDLYDKLFARAKTLSGGQKRKLQLAMMFAGNSAVCCVDEVSTGLDPISRRNIWEILLAERSRRTIIMTTHFLDEADFLADNIAIMYKGTLKAEGTAASLKHQFGSGYTVQVPGHVDFDMGGQDVQKETSRHQTKFRVKGPSQAALLVDELEARHIRDYSLSGPTMEELFLKVTGDTIEDETETLSKHVDTEQDTGIPKKEIATTERYELRDGRPLSAFSQWLLLFSKRFRILRRRYIPYIFTLAVPLIGAGISTKLITFYDEPLACPTPSSLQGHDYEYRSDMGKSFPASPGYSYTYLLLGPPDQMTDARLARIADVYSSDHYSSNYSGYGNVSDFESITAQSDTFANVTETISDAQNNDVLTYNSIYGGVWLGDSPTIFYSTIAGSYSIYMLNMVNQMVSNVPISVGFHDFMSLQTPQLYDFKPMIFTVYFGLIMACAPAFFALYPTNERISFVRSMQYSNGIRPLPLWLSHLAFDSIVVVIISAVSTAIFASSKTAWTGVGYIFLILFLYGLVSTLFSYVVSMFAKSAVAAWFLISAFNIIFFFAYFGAILGLQSSTPYYELEDVMNALFFGLGVVSPIVSLERALNVALGQFAALCNNHPLGSIYLFGGPILYLLVQGAVLFLLLLWLDGYFHLPTRRSKPSHDAESTELYDSDLMGELTRLKSNNSELGVQSVTKSFGKNLAVDNVTFSVHNSEIFALLGPNGAGKSTLISLIRGDIKPSTSDSSIHIAGHSILSSPVSARASLGVCPQFDSADALTVSETLHFFAKIRGVKEAEHNVSTVIAACGLETWSNQLAHRLSGGTKRKLSLAVALVGNPKVLVLDEPSSALDASAKRNLWRILQAVGKGRAVVLTTHSMEEADALADRIGIVSSRMLAIGERETMKRRAGDAYHVHMVSRSAPRTSPQEIQTMSDWATQTFPGAKINRQAQGGQIRFEIPVEGQNLVGIIKALEAAKRDLGVEFYSVGKATLDEVFENIVRRFGSGKDS